MWFRLFVRVALFGETSWTEGEVLRWSRCCFKSVQALCWCPSKSLLCSTERINRLTVFRAAQTTTRKEIFPSDGVRCVWLYLETWAPVRFESLLLLFRVSYEFSRVSFADEDFQQPQFGFDVLVFAVLHCQRGAILLLYISARTTRHNKKRLFRVKTHNSISLAQHDPALLFLTVRFVWRTGLRTLSNSCGSSSSPLASLGAAPRVPACERDRRNV